MSSELPPLDPDVCDLLERARAKDVDELAPERRAAILGAIVGSIASLPTVVPSDTVASAAAKATRIATLLVTFGAGIGAGVAADCLVAPQVGLVAPSSAPVALARPAAPAPSETAAAIPVTALPDVPSSARAVVRPPAPAPSSSVTIMPSARGLAAERALLDVARTALARGEAQDALDAASRHAREYPAGTLKEEREAIAIRALVALGRKGEARARASAFEREFPNSLNRGAVKSALEGSLE